MSADGKNVYVASGDVFVYTRDAGTGTLSLLQSHPLTEAVDVLENPAGTRVYVLSSRRVTVYDRNATTGALTFSSDEFWPDSVFIEEGVTSPDGAFLYTVGDAFVRILALDPGTGEVSLESSVNIGDANQSF